MNVKSTRALFCLNMTISALLLEQTNVSPPLLFSLFFYMYIPICYFHTRSTASKEKDHQTLFRYVSVQNWWVWGMFKTLPWEELDSRIRKGPPCYSMYNCTIYTALYSVKGIVMKNQFYLVLEIYITKAMLCLVNCWWKLPRYMYYII